MKNFDHILNTQDQPFKTSLKSGLNKPKSRLKKIRNKILIIGTLGYIGTSIIYFTIYLISLI